ncbi:MAG: trypsin-like peptidase domain-containing protein [Proteobacteria bacterium]|nr:trypsin-like peptidase domain-containing protein [Pseudomonadota bacterium]MBU6425299.1 trypsin-like peptidase domain-containing protein [Rhodospirillales bacterium]
MWWRVLALGLLWAFPAVASAQFSLFQGAPHSLAPLVKMVAPSVVGITVTESSGGQGATPAPLRGGKATPPITEAAGSGFIISSSGFIVTNDHVIAGAAQINVTLDDGQKLTAQLVGADDLTDIAVIRIKSSKPLQPAHWANSSMVQIGDWVLAAGNPFALGNSFTLGIISAEGRDIGEGPFNHFLQLDAPINPGNSGGPAFNMQGGVIGINSAIVSPSGGSVGIGFAIPSNSAAPIVAQLIAHGAVARGWLGVSVADPDDGTQGAVITGLEPGGPADEAGLSQSDVVVTVNGEAISGADGLTRAIASMAPGRKVVLGVRKNAHIFHLPVIVGRRPVQIGE